MPHNGHTIAGLQHRNPDAGWPPKLPQISWRARMEQHGTRTCVLARRCNHDIGKHPGRQLQPHEEASLGLAPHDVTARLRNTVRGGSLFVSWAGSLLSVDRYALSPAAPLAAPRTARRSAARKRPAAHPATPPAPPSAAALPSSCRTRTPPPNSNCVIVTAAAAAHSSSSQLISHPDTRWFIEPEEYSTPLRRICSIMFVPASSQPSLTPGPTSFENEQLEITWLRPAVGAGRFCQLRAGWSSERVVCQSSGANALLTTCPHSQLPSACRRSRAGAGDAGRGRATAGTRRPTAPAGCGGARGLSPQGTQKGAGLKRMGAKT